MTLIPLHTLAVLLLLAIGLSYVITGSVIGYIPRVVWCLLTNRIRIPRAPTDKEREEYPGRQWYIHPLWNLFTCPSCNAWWCGLALGWFFGLPLEQWFQAAFASCGVAAIVEAQWHLAASEDFAKMFGNKTGASPAKQEESKGANTNGTEGENR